MMMQAEFGDENPGTDMEDEYGELNDYDLEASVPIDASLIYLAFAGTAFALYYYKSNKAQQKNQG